MSFVCHTTYIFIFVAIHCSLSICTIYSICNVMHLLFVAQTSFGLLLGGEVLSHKGKFSKVCWKMGLFVNLWSLCMIFSMQNIMVCQKEGQSLSDAVGHCVQVWGKYGWWGDVRGWLSIADKSCSCALLDLRNIDPVLVSVQNSVLVEEHECGFQEALEGHYCNFLLLLFWSCKHKNENCWRLWKSIIPTYVNMPACQHERAYVHNVIEGEGMFEDLDSDTHVLHILSSSRKIVLLRDWSEAVRVFYSRLLIFLCILWCAITPSWCMYMNIFLSLLLAALTWLHQDLFQSLPFKECDIDSCHFFYLCTRRVFQLFYMEFLQSIYKVTG